MSTESTDTMPAEFSRQFRLAELADTPEHKIEIVATAAERNALAARYSLMSLDALSAQLTVRGDVSGEVVVEGRLQADIAQECVVTLEAVGETIDSAFEQRYTSQPADPADDLVIGPDDIEPPEQIIGESIDLGELVAQFLSLAINPYPRAPDADSQADQYRAEAADDGPFAALAKLREGNQS